MAHPEYIREKARRLRSENGLTLDRIAEQLDIPKTTAWYWIEDLPVPKSEFTSLPPSEEARRKGNQAMQEKYAALRYAAYRDGWWEFDELNTEPSFRDFLCLYIGEGYKKNRNTVAIGNSDPRVMRLADYWIRRLTDRKILYSVQYHADQDPEYLCKFWSFGLGFDPDDFRYQRKSNSGKLNGRNWRSKWGVLTITVNDTYLRSRLQAWMDRLQDSWIDSICGV